ncbi:MAG: N-acetylmuramoyl-L-alanine amidase [Clostridiales bacterium]|nr:N-acetylmuramoyl-L-alanine amidase [Clostridiales bacterium]
MKHYLALILTLAMISIIIILLYRSLQKVRTTFIGAFTNGNVVVIDAGHGGMDGGATGISGLLEKDCTLTISKKLDLFMSFLGVPTVMTRTEDLSLDHQGGATIRKNKVSDLKARLRLAEETENAVFVSIHLNKFPQSQYRGAQVFYGPNNQNSELLAKSLQKCLITAIADGNTSIHKKATDDVYLMKKATCPAVTVECGFVSNPEEEVLLKDDGYQKKMVLAIAGGYLEYVNEST